MTTREALEHIYGQIAVERWMEAKKAPSKPVYQKHDISAPEVTESSPEASAALADTPHLTDWDEWNEVELSETDPTSTLQIRR